MRGGEQNAPVGEHIAPVWGAEKPTVATDSAHGGEFVFPSWRGLRPKS